MRRKPLELSVPTLRSTTITTFLLACLTCTFSASLIAQQPDEKSRQPDSAAAVVASLFEESVWDFYFPGCLDNEQKGYHEAIDESGNFVPGEKFLTLQARQVWFFSSVVNHNLHREEAAKAAELGYQFLLEHFQDKKNGGYFAKVDRDGTPTDRRKHVYPMSFVIYAFVELHRVDDDPQPLAEAMKVFETLEQHCYDKQHGGYNELFTEDWQPFTDTSQWGIVGPVGTKTYNSHLHLLEAFTQLYLETKDQAVGKRLAELISINTLTVRHPDFDCNIDAWTPEWRMVETEKNMRASYGHDLECAWLVIAAAKALSQNPTVYQSWAVDLCDHAIKFGYDSQHGGFSYTGALGVVGDETKKEWWTQAESMVAMLTLHQLTGDEKYRSVFDKTLNFVAEHQVSELGGWWAAVNQDGSPSDNKMRASMWKGAYHDGRALLMCSELLKAKLP